VSVPPLDQRVMERGRPAERVKLHYGWLVIRRAPDGPGVVLEVRFPGCPREDQPHDDQAAAVVAATAIWRRYEQQVEELMSQCDGGSPGAGGTGTSRRSSGTSAPPSAA
jgi:hypothetical protein